MLNTNITTAWNIVTLTNNATIELNGYTVEVCGYVVSNNGMVIPVAINDEFPCAAIMVATSHQAAYFDYGAVISVPSKEELNNQAIIMHEVGHYVHDYAVLSGVKTAAKVVDNMVIDDEFEMRADEYAAKTCGARKARKEIEDAFARANEACGISYDELPDEAKLSIAARLAALDALAAKECCDDIDDLEALLSELTDMQQEISNAVTEVADALSE